MKNHKILHEDHDYGFGVKFNRSEIPEDKSPISSFLDGRVQFFILLIYGTISVLFILLGDPLFGYLIGGCALACNLIWLYCKGFKVFIKWFLNLVEA